MICIGSFALRTIPASSVVFQDHEIVFLESDPWYHVRLVESLVAHFPHLNRFDPYGQFPDGQALPVAPLFDWLIAGTSLVIGLGHPSSRTVEMTCAWFPPLLGTMVIVVTYLIGSRLLGRVAGLLAAAQVAIMPSNFFAFSMLGYTDHHVAEVLFSSLTILFLVAANESHPTEPQLGREWTASIWAGIALTAYVLTWIGAAMFIAIIAAWFVMQIIANHLRGIDTRRLMLSSLCVFGIPLPFAIGATTVGFPLREHCIALTGSLVGVLVLCLTSHICTSSRMNRRLFPGLVAVLGLGAISTFAIASPGMWSGIVSQIRRFNVSGGALQLVETTPLLRGANGWTLGPAYGQFTTGFFLAIPAMLLLAIRSIKRTCDASLLFLIWSTAILAATLGQSRFTYYSAVVVALLSAFLAKEIATWIDRSITTPVFGRMAKAVVIVMVVGVSLVPNLPPVWELASHPDAPNADWRESLAWLRAHTPEPFGDAAAYFARHDPPNAAAYAYPPTAYSVMNWWDYGYWIVRAGRRMPASNPTQHGAGDAARFFLAQDEATASKIMTQFGSRYVILDALMGFLPSKTHSAAGGKFPSLIAWAGEASETYLETCQERDSVGRLQPVTLFYPACHQSFYARLYIFRGKVVTPTEVWVVKVESRIDPTLGAIREITDSKKFATHADAVRFITTNTGYRIAGRSPFTSCVPLEALRDYKLSHQSPTKIGAQAGSPIAYVEIYEFMNYVGRSRDASH